MKETDSKIPAIEEERFQKVVEAAPCAMVMVDKNQNIVLINTQTEKIFGYERQELLGQKLEILIPQSFRSRHQGQVDNHFITPLTRPMGVGRDLFALHKNGKEFPVEIGLNPLQMNEGSFILASIIDITERKNNELILKESEERFRLLADSVPVLIWMAGPDKKHFYFNKTWLNFTGRSLEQEIGDAWATGLHPEDLKFYFKTYSASFDEKKPFSIEYRLKNKEGVYRWLIDTGIPRFNQKGEFLGYIGGCTDISQQKALEQTANDAQRMAHLGSWQWDIKNNTEIWSDEQFRIFGYEPKTIQAHHETFMNAIPVDKRQKVLSAFRSALEDNLPCHIESSIVRPNGELRHVLLQGEVKRNEKNEAVLMSGTVFDITDRKKVEQMKNEFIATVSHELRTPLTSIRGSLGLISGGAVGDMPDKAKPLVQIALSNCERLVRMINDILDIEKIESGKIDFHLKICDLNEVIKNSVKANEDYASQYAVLLKINETSESAFASIDVDRMTQVLTNLISNAVKFSSKGDIVLISVSRHGSNIRVSVMDKGKGIPENFKTKIFGKFAQADSSSTKQKGGTGLGLNICKKIVEKHGGKIGFESIPGAGATFYFDLPGLECSKDDNQA
ncbi:MAG: PAS domain-containing sensor histidine kinase [Deltaproteobacteria bacterium]|nr:PAS domain-containing sensor histidine kinase [Deltaproteobacteria bacterium]